MIPQFCRRSCLGSGRADVRRNALQLCARLSYSRPETCTGAGAHKHTLGAGALTHAVSLHRHANERIVLLAKDDTGTCLLLCPVALSASCCRRPLAWVCVCLTPSAKNIHTHNRTMHVALHTPTHLTRARVSDK